MVSCVWLSKSATSCVENFHEKKRSRGLLISDKTVTKVEQIMRKNRWKEGRVSMRSLPSLPVRINPQTSLSLLSDAHTSVCGYAG